MPITSLEFNQASDELRCFIEIIQWMEDRPINYGNRSVDIWIAKAFVSTMFDGQSWEVISRQTKQLFENSFGLGRLELQAWWNPGVRHFHRRQGEKPRL